jgi:hypothetical protein
MYCSRPVDCECLCTGVCLEPDCRIRSLVFLQSPHLPQEGPTNIPAVSIVSESAGNSFLVCSDEACFETVDLRSQLLPCTYCIQLIV